MRFVAGRSAVLEKLAGALMRMAGVFLAEIQLAGTPLRRGWPCALWRRSVGKRLPASECKIGKQVHGWQADSRLAGGWNWR